MGANTTSGNGQTGLLKRRHLPSALANLQEILLMCRGRQLAFFLDYDGTLTPITPTPMEAILPPAMHRALLRLSAKCTIGVISGRDLHDIRQRINIDTIVYAGSHGFDIGGPNGLHMEQPDGVALLPELDLIQQELSQKLSDIQGAIVERKRFVITVHFRLVANHQVERVEEAVDQAVVLHPQFRKRTRRLSLGRCRPYACGRPIFSSYSKTFSQMR